MLVKTFELQCDKCLEYFCFADGDIIRSASKEQLVERAEEKGWVKNWGAKKKHLCPECLIKHKKGIK